MTSITQNKRVATRVIPDYHLAIGRHQLHRRQYKMIFRIYKIYLATCLSTNSKNNISTN